MSSPFTRIVSKRLKILEDLIERFCQAPFDSLNVKAFTSPNSSAQSHANKTHRTPKGFSALCSSFKHFSGFNNMYQNIVVDPFVTIILFHRTPP